MHLAFFTHTYPSLNTNGGAELVYSALKELQNKKIKVSLFIYAVPEYYDDCIKNEEKIKKLCDNVYIFRANRKNSIFKSVLKNPLQFFFPADNLIIPSFDHEKDTHKILDEINPDRIFIYDWWAAPAVFRYPKKKTIIVGDLLHSPFENSMYKRYMLGYLPRRLLTKIKDYFVLSWVIRNYKKMQNKIFSECDYGGSFGYHDAQTLKSMGCEISKYYKSPYTDNSNENYLSKIGNNKNKKDKYKIITSLGRLNATATSSGLHLLYKELLPIMNREIGADNFEVHVLGDGYLREGIKGLKNEKNVFIRGYVDDLESELDSSDAFLLATNLLLGYRCRLINCLSRALPIVISEFDTVNQPEFIHKENCLIGKTPEEIVLNLKELLENKELKSKIQIGARKTYLDNFQPEKTMNVIINELEN
jgi:glycosyltransferase involved in cell wall biosynthesis